MASAKEMPIIFILHPFPGHILIKEIKVLEKQLKDDKIFRKQFPWKRFPLHRDQEYIYRGKKFQGIFFICPAWMNR